MKNDECYTLSCYHLFTIFCNLLTVDPSNIIVKDLKIGRKQVSTKWATLVVITVISGQRSRLREEGDR